MPYTCEVAATKWMRIESAKKIAQSVDESCSHGSIATPNPVTDVIHSNDMTAPPRSARESEWDIHVEDEVMVRTN